MPVAKYYHAGMKIFPILATMLAAGLAMAEPRSLQCNSLCRLM